MNWKLLALDLDGTLLNSREEISEQNLKAICEASQAGVKVIIATGRSITSARRYIHALRTGDPSITYNGAIIHNGDSILRTLTIERDSIYSTLSAIKELGQPALVYSNDEKRYLDEPENLIDGFYEFSKLSGIENVFVPDLLSERWEDVIRISVFTDEETTVMLEYELGNRLGDRVKTVKTYFPEWNFWIFEVLNPLCSKPTALQFLCDHFEIDPKESLAVGDNHNDIEMLRWAGMGIAMRNSLPDVARQADFVTERNNDEHGVAEVINRYILSA
jgi:Cof subfamily protein (haloacid dehalogenase superfamily)